MESSHRRTHRQSRSAAFLRACARHPSCNPIRTNRCDTPTSEADFCGALMRDQRKGRPARPSPQEAGQAHRQQAAAHPGQRAHASGTHIQISPAAAAEKAELAAAEEAELAAAEETEQAAAEEADLAPPENAQLAAALEHGHVPFQVACKAFPYHLGGAGSDPGSCK